MFQYVINTYNDSVYIYIYNVIIDPGMCKDGEVRLVNGNIEQEGRAEVCLQGVWSTVCDWDWNALDAYVMCRNLGYEGSQGQSL